MLIFNGGLGFDSMPDANILVFVSRHFYQGLVLVSRSWSRIFS